MHFDHPLPLSLLRLILLFSVCIKIIALFHLSASTAGFIYVEGLVKYSCYSNNIPK